MDSLTTTSFGLLIAYVLPGLIGLYSCIFWSETIRALFETFTKAESNVGLFLLVLAAAVVVGLQVNAIRWFVYECCVSRSATRNYGRSGGDRSVPTIQAALDENFRYHQFYGSISIILPFVFLSWLRYFDSAVTGSTMFWFMTGGCVVAAGGMTCDVIALVHKRRTAPEVLEGLALLQDFEGVRHERRFQFEAALIVSVAAVHVAFGVVWMRYWRGYDWSQLSRILLIVWAGFVLELCTVYIAMEALRRYEIRIRPPDERASRFRERKDAA